MRLLVLEFVLAKIRISQIGQKIAKKLHHWNEIAQSIRHKFAYRQIYGIFWENHSNEIRSNEIRIRWKPSFSTVLK